jgi:hypothetical protein
MAVDEFAYKLRQSQRFRKSWGYFAPTPTLRFLPGVASRQRIA